MTLVDTSVWVDHFRRGNPEIKRLLEDGSAGTHPFVLGELACGNLRNRLATLADLGRLPSGPLVREREVHHLLEARRLWGTGLGWVDMHLLASAMLAGWDLFTTDRALKTAAIALDISAES